ncbi:MAG: hypothetical protein RhofKO_25730 [Rhodothermales bacterium]
MSDYDLVRSRMATMPSVPTDVDEQAGYLMRLWEAMRWMYEVPGLTLAEAYTLARDEDDEWERRLLHALLDSS